jgi:type IV secretory pathway TraG/TraD family ATPase VirD4
MRLCFLVLGLILQGAAFGQQPYYRQVQDYDLPEPGPIIAGITGEDEIDTAARKVAAANILWSMTQFLAGTTATADMPPKLARRNQDYFNALTALRKARENTPFPDDPCDKGRDCLRRKYFEATWGYEFDEAFLNQVLATVRPDLRNRFMADRGKISNPAPTAPVTVSGSAQPSGPVPLSVEETSEMSDATFIKWLLGITAAIILLARLRRRKPGQPAVSTNYGTARFADPAKDLTHARAFQQGTFLGKGAIHGATSRPETPFAPVYTTEESHTLIVAPTRTGKGTRVIIPTLLRYGGSILTIDPKGENAAITARARRAFGQTIHIVNPWGQLAPEYARLGLPASATYNPLDVLDRGDPNAVAAAQSLAETICPKATNAKDAFWQGSAANILAAVFLWLADQPGETKTLARARQITTLSRKDFREQFLVKMAASQAFDGAIAEMVGQLIDLADETYSGILSNLNEATKFLSDPQVKQATAASSFSMDDLMAGKTTVYLVIPPARMHTHRTWLRLVLTSALQSFKRQRLSHPDTRCMFLIDEFAALGCIEDIPREIATISGYGLDMTLIVQGLDQLKANYGEPEAATILNNCAWKWFCNINDKETAKYVSECLGKKTIRTKTEGETTGTTSNPRGGGSSAGKSTTWSETGRDLLAPDEVLNLGRDAAVVFQPHGYPLFLQPIDYWNLQAAFAHLQRKHPGLYWMPPLNDDPNPYMAARAGAEVAGEIHVVRSNPLGQVLSGARKLLLGK